MLLYAVLSDFFSFFFFNDTATTEIYTLSLHDALPICVLVQPPGPHLGTDLLQGVLADRRAEPGEHLPVPGAHAPRPERRSEEHTSELQSRLHLVCRLLLEKKNEPLRPTHVAQQLASIV